MFDKIKNYKLHEDTIVMLYGCVVSITFLLISIAYENVKLIKNWALKAINYLEEFTIPDLI